GIATAQKVRLMHAAVRYFARASPPFRAHPEWGIPINQEELGGTLLAFSSVTLDGLASLGLKAPAAEQDAYLHFWKVVGHVLGLDPRLLVRDMGEARKAWMVLIRRNFHRTDEGLLLLKDHLAFLDNLVPGELLDPGNSALLRYLVGRRISVGCFDLPPAGRMEAFLHIVRGILGLEKLGYLLFPGLAKLARRVSFGLMESLQAYLNDGHTKPFRVPAALNEG
ncbi:MAG TPA: oxygenase MpaB family protein, partial [Fibrobacteria bacterium]|nr:oxygenase MpaB family protein [Fibrobacteria bacterium]